jgi:hypothetical protein
LQADIDKWRPVVKPADIQFKPNVLGCKADLPGHLTQCYIDFLRPEFVGRFAPRYPGARITAGTVRTVGVDQL